MSEDVPAGQASQITALVEQAMQAHFEGGEARLSEFCATLGDLREPVLLRLAKLRRIGLLGEAPLDFAPEPAAAAPERLGDFELLELLGRGGMGVVYRARQISLDREVAVKLIRPEQVLFPGVRERFQREVEVVARLQHDGIIRLHCFGEDRGVPWFAMELVRGCSLADTIARHAGRAVRELSGADLAACLPDPVADGPGAALFAGSWEQCVVAILERAALALDEAHRQGVIHRDVKPSNIMVTAAGRVVVLDFGLASSRHAERLTRSGAELGTVHYMAPEQFRGALDDVDERADVYALGVVLRELLTLRSAFDGTTIDEVVRQVREGLTTPFGSRGGRANRELETVCLMAMDRDPARRYPTARLLARDLRNWLERRPVAAVRPTLGLRLRRAAERHRTIATAVALLGLAAIVAPLLLAWRERELRRDLERTNEALVAEVERADANLHTAAAALARTLGLLRDAQVNQVPDLKPLVDEVVDQSDSFLASLAASNPREQTTRLRVAEVLVEAAAVQSAARELERAEALFTRALELVDGVGGDVDRSDLVELEARLALIELQQLRGAPRAAALTAALARVRPHGESRSRAVAVRSRIARCHELLGIVLSTNDPERVVNMATAHELYSSGVAERPTLEGWLEVARGARSLAMDRLAVRDLPASTAWEEAADRAMANAQALAAGAAAKDVEALAGDLTVRATILSLSGRHEQALVVLGQAGAHFEALMGARPSRTSYLLAWLQVREKTAQSLVALTRRTEAREILRSSQRRAAPAFEVWPDDPMLLRAHLSLWRRLVELAVKSWPPDEAPQADVAAARALVECIGGMRLEVAVIHEECSRCWTQLAQLALLAGDAPAALDAIARGEERRAMATTLAAAERLDLGADTLTVFVGAEALLRVGRTDEAAARLDAAKHFPKGVLDVVPSLRRFDGDARFAKTFARLRGKR